MAEIILGLVLGLLSLVVLLFGMWMSSGHLAQWVRQRRARRKLPGGRGDPWQ